jgi:hypothetical protein
MSDAFIEKAKLFTEIVKTIMVAFPKNKIRDLLRSVGAVSLDDQVFLEIQIEVYRFVMALTGLCIPVLTAGARGDGKRIITSQMVLCCMNILIGHHGFRRPTRDIFASCYYAEHPPLSIEYYLRYFDALGESLHSEIDYIKSYHRLKILGPLDPAGSPDGSPPSGSGSPDGSPPPDDSPGGPGGRPDSPGGRPDSPGGRPDSSGVPGGSSGAGANPESQTASIFFKPTLPARTRLLCDELTFLYYSFATVDAEELLEIASEREGLQIPGWRLEDGKFIRPPLMETEWDIGLPEYRVIKEFIREKTNDNEILEDYNYTVSVDDMKMLFRMKETHKEKYLNSNVIQIYLTLFQNFFMKTGRSSGIVIVNSYFMDGFFDKKIEMTYTKVLNYFYFHHIHRPEVLIIPVNLSNTHFFCLVLDLRNKIFYRYEPFPTFQDQKEEETTCSNMFNYIKTYVDVIYSDPVINKTSFKEWKLKFVHDGQRDGYNCGAYTCMYIVSLCFFSLLSPEAWDGNETYTHVTKTRQTIENFRDHMAQRILSGTFVADCSTAEAFVLNETVKNWKKADEFEIEARKNLTVEMRKMRQVQNKDDAERIMKEIVEQKELEQARIENFLSGNRRLAKQIRKNAISEKFRTYNKSFRYVPYVQFPQYHEIVDTPIEFIKQEMKYLEQVQEEISPRTRNEKNAILLQAIEDIRDLETKLKILEDGLSAERNKSKDAQDRVISAIDLRRESLEVARRSVDSETNDSPTEEENIKVAIAFLAHDGVHNVDFWEQWFGSDAMSKYISVTVWDESEIGGKQRKKGNPKFRDTFKANYIKKLSPTEWGTISVVDAEVALIRDIREKYTNATHIIMLSGTCVPLLTPTTLLDKLSVDKISRIRIGERKNITINENRIHVVSHHSNCILSQTDADTVCKEWKTFKKGTLKLLMENNYVPKTGKITMTGSGKNRTVKQDDNFMGYPDQVFFGTVLCKQPKNKDNMFMYRDMYTSDDTVESPPRSIEYDFSKLKDDKREKLFKTMEKSKKTYRSLFFRRVKNLDYNRWKETSFSLDIFGKIIETQKKYYTLWRHLVLAYIENIKRKGKH